MNRSIFILLLLLIGIISFSQNFSNWLREKAVSSFSFCFSPKRGDHQEIKNLELENHQLRAQLDLVYEWINSEKRIQEEVSLFRSLGQEKLSVSKSFIERKEKEIKALLQKRAIAGFGKIIYRDPSSWSSSCWIDVGEENNEAIGQIIVAKNSPVVSGSNLIGIIEYVGKRHSRVRLITDSGLKTAVRAVRGSIFDREISLLSQELLTRLKKHRKEDSFILQLDQWQKSLLIGWEDEYLAKGEIMGSSAHYFRSLKPALKGIGFNCDFKDLDGETHDLRDAILREGDFLITSGLDGVFPPGLKVGIVNKVGSLSPGAFAYELEATVASGEFSTLSSVTILPPVSVD